MVGLSEGIVCVCELFKFLVYEHPLLGLVCIHIQSSVVVVETPFIQSY